MTVNSYLTGISGNAVIRDMEKESISKSLATLQTRLNSYFGTDISQHFLFGSYSRGTILPRRMDEQSDVDYMVVFRDVAFKPQTYLNKLRNFVNLYYSSSDIFQSNPTIVLSLNHIKFELVPAISSFWEGLQIPAKNSDLNDWISTNPNDFNQKLIAANQANHNMIKPVVRLVKYWNAKNGYPFESFQLEKMAADRSYFFIGGIWGNGQLKDYFFEVMSGLELDWFAAKYKKDALSRAKSLIFDTKQYLSIGQETLAEQKVKKLIPPIGLLSGLGSF